MLIFSVAACDNGSGTGVNNQQAGTVLGAVGGGLLGNTVGRGAGKTVATIGGAAVGGMVGNSVGGNMDRNNARCRDYGEC